MSARVSAAREVNPRRDAEGVRQKLVQRVNNKKQASKPRTTVQEESNRFSRLLDRFNRESII